MIDALESGDDGAPWYTAWGAFLDRDEFVGSIVELWRAGDLYPNEFEKRYPFAPPTSEDGSYTMAVEVSVTPNLAAPTPLVWPASTDRSPGLFAVGRDGLDTDLAVLRWRAHPRFFGIFSRPRIPGQWGLETQLGDLVDGQRADLIADRSASLAAWTWDIDTTEHVAVPFRSGGIDDGDDVHLVELWRPDGGQWRTGRQVALTAHHDVTTPPAAWTWGHDKTQHLAFVTAAGELVELWFKRGQGWRRGTGLTRAAAAAELRSLQPAAFTWGSTQHVLFVSRDNALWEATFRRGRGWQARNLTATFDVPTPVSPPAVTRTPREAVAGYRTTDGVQVLTRDEPEGDWQRDDSLAAMLPDGLRGRPDITYADDGRGPTVWVAVTTDESVHLRRRNDRRLAVVGLPGDFDVRSDARLVPTADAVHLVFDVPLDGALADFVVENGTARLTYAGLGATPGASSGSGRLAGW